MTNIIYVSVIRKEKKNINSNNMNYSNNFDINYPNGDDDNDDGKSNRIYQYYYINEINNNLRIITILIIGTS